MARLEAERLRLRWAAGVDAPDAETLVAAWRETLQALRGVRQRLRDRTQPGAARRSCCVPWAQSSEAVAARSTQPALPRPGWEPNRCSTSLRLLGRTRPAAAQTVDDALTPREHEVLTLVAEGRSNREIGGQLFISAKTVSVHVSNILAKLGAAGRTEAVAIARRRGLLSDSPG